MLPAPCNQSALLQTVGAARPFDDNGTTWYRWTLAAPRNEKPVRIEYRAEKDAGYRLRGWEWEE